MSKTFGIVVRVHPDRSYLAELVINVNGTERVFPVSAMTEPEIGLTDPEIGTYHWVKTIDVPANDAEALSAYGRKIIFFKAQGSEQVLAIHGGDSDLDGKLLATEGGLRLNNDDLQLLCVLIVDSYPVLCIEECKLGFLERWTHRKVSNASLHRLSRGDRQMYDEESDLGDFIFWRWLFYDDFYVGQSDDGFVAGGGEFDGGGASSDFQPDISLNEGEAGFMDGVAMEESIDQLPIINDPFANESIQATPVVGEGVVHESVIDSAPMYVESSTPDISGTSY